MSNLFRRLFIVISTLALSSYAFAEEAAKPINAMLSQGLLLVGFVAIFYFLFWRPQSKRAKEQKEMMASLKVNDEVLTSSGIVGKIRKLEEQTIELEVAENVVIKMQRASVQTIYPKS